MPGPDSFARRRWLEFHGAAVLLTRIPLPVILAGAQNIPQGRALWAYPLVGMFIGAVAGGVFMLAGAIGLPVTLAAIFALGAGVLLSGALHEDGLADFADAMGGKTAHDKLRIMRDSRLGVYGAIALIFSFAARGGALIALDDMAPAALVVSHALARGALAVPMRQFAPARGDGITSQAGAVSLGRVFAALIIAAAIASLMFPAPVAQMGLIGAVAAAVMVAYIAKRQIGGLTGDVLGAGEQCAQVAILCVLTMTRT